MNIKTLLRLLVRWLGLLQDGAFTTSAQRPLPPPLTREEEAALLNGWKMRTPQSVIEHNLRLVVYIARRLKYRRGD